MRRLLAILLLLVGTVAAAQEMTVAAAADMSAALPELVAAYTKKTGQAVKLSFGASGNLTNQIRNGAPFDLFFSADEDYPQQLIKEGLAAKETLYRYAVGRLVLWVPNDSPLDLSKLGIKALLDPSVKKLSIANPATAPYGRAAAAALRHFEIYDQVSSRLVVGENISQAAQFVESGNAQAGLIALSHALAPAMKDKGRYWLVPLDAYPTLNQAAVVLSKSKQQDAARKFLDFVRGPEANSLLTSYGFSLPEDAGRNQSPQADLATYENKAAGFRFQYPSSLHLDSSTGRIFRYPGNNDFLAIDIRFSAADPKPYLELKKHVPVTTETQEINHLTWVIYSYPSGAGRCTYWTGESVCFEGIANGVPGKHLSDALVKAMDEMQSTLVFAAPSSRMDSKIAAVKVGDRFGGLRVSRVVRKIAGSKNSWKTGSAEVDFNGSLTLNGSIGNNQSMNSGPDYAMSLDPASCSLLPQIGYSVNFETTGFQIHFNNGDFVAEQAGRYPDNAELTVIINHLSAIYSSAGGVPFVQANLVKIVDIASASSAERP